MMRQEEAKQKIYFFPTLIPIIPPFQQSNIPILQKITLRDDFKPFFPGREKGVGRIDMNPMDSTQWFEVWWGIFLETLANGEKLSVWFSAIPAP
jgi:hypothetical protein